MKNEDFGNGADVNSLHRNVKADYFDSSPTPFTMAFLMDFPPMHPGKPRPPQGFTLVELLVVISIIGLLAGLAVPAISSGLNKAKEAKKVSNLRQIHQACQLWSADNDGRIVPPIGAPDAGGGTGVAWCNFLATNTLGLSSRKLASRDKDIFVDPFFKGYNTNTFWVCGYAMNTRPGVPDNNTDISYQSSGDTIPMKMAALTAGSKRAFIIDTDGTYAFDPGKIKSGAAAFATNRHGGGLGMVMMYDGHVEKLTMDQAYLSANDPSKR